MRRFLILLFITCALLSAAPTVYLRTGQPGSYASVTAASSDPSGGIAVTAASHGFVTGDAISILDVDGCFAANGRRIVTRVDSDHFLLRDSSPANGTLSCTTAYISGGRAGRVAPHTMRDHPRMLFDGPGGVVESSLAAKGTNTNVPWQALVSALTTYIIQGCPNACYYADLSRWNGNDGRAVSGYYATGFWTMPLVAAIAWKTGGTLTATQRQQALDAAKFAINNVEKLTEFTTGCDESTGCGNRDGADYGSYYLAYSAAAYSIIRNQLTPAERATYANKMLNDKADNCVNPESTGTGTISLQSDPADLRRVIGVGTHFTSLTPDSVLLTSGGRWAFMVRSIESDTSLHVTNAVSVPFLNVPYDIATPWQSNTCGVNWMVEHHISSPKFMWRGFTYIRAGLDAHEGNNRTLTKIMGMIYAGLALADDDPRAITRLEESYNYWYDSELRYGKDFYTGFSNGGESYGSNRNQMFQDTIVVAAVNSIASPAPTYQNGVWIKRAALLPIFMRDPSLANDHFVLFGYSGNSQDMSPWRNVPSFMANYLFPGAEESRYAADYYTHVLKHAGNPNTQMWTTAGMSYLQGGAAAMALLFTSPADPTSSISNLPTQYLFSDTDINPDTALGNIVSRTGWRSLTDTLLFFQASAQTQFDRQNEYVAYEGNHGSYKIIKGSNLLTEDNGGSGDMQFSNYLEVGPYGANTRSSLLIYATNGPYDVIQKNKITRWAGSNPGGDPQSRYMYAMGDFTGAYKGSAGLTRLTRQIAHLKSPGAADFVVVYDDAQIALTSAGQGIRTYLHYANNGQAGEGITVAAADGSVVSTGARGKLLTQIFAPAGTGTVRLFSGDDVSLSGNTAQSSGNYAGGASTTYRVGFCRSADGGATCDNGAHDAEFLVVHKPDTNLAASMPRISNLASVDPNFRGVQIDDAMPRVVLFGQHSAVYSSTRFNAAFTGTAQILLTGLSVGTYDVYRDGAVIQHSAAVDGSSSLYLESTGGSFQVVAAGTPPPVISTSSGSLLVTAGEAYSTNLTSVGGSGASVWSLVGGTLPAGLTLTSAGHLSGTARTIGVTNVMVQVRDQWPTPSTTAQPLSISVQSDLVLRTLGTGSMASILAYKKADQSAPCFLELSTSGSFSVVSQSQTDSNRLPSREAVWLGLTAGTNYFERITCGTVTRTTEFSTAPTSAGTSVNVSFTAGVPPRIGAVKMAIDYGPSNTLGSSAEAVCGARCVVVVQTCPSCLIWSRRRYLDAGGHTVAAGSPHPAIAPTQ